MNALTQYLNQAKKIWTSLPLAPRVTLVSFLAVLVLLVAMLGVWSSQGDYVLMMAGIAPEDAAAISASLKDDKIPFRYEPSRGAIFVPAANADTARLSLASKGLPKNATEGFEIFDKASFGTTEYVQKINHIRALQGTLSRNIQALDAVDSARVTLSIPEDELFSREKKVAKGSVVVKLRHGRILEAEQIAAIRHLVASSVPKLDANNVTIVDSTGRMLSRPRGENDAFGNSDEQLSVQKRVEDHFTDKVQSFLDQFLGANQSAVRVTAAVNFDRLERSVQKMDPETKVMLEESTRSEDVNNGKGGPSGVPGVASNTPPGSTASTEGGNSSSKKQNTKSNKYHYDVITEKVVQQPGSVARLSIAVLVAPKSTGAGDEKKVTPRTPQELAVLTEIVRNAVGFSVDRKDSIKVEELPFSETAVSTGPLAPGAPMPVMDLVREHLPDILAFLGVSMMAFVFYRLISQQFKPQLRVEKKAEVETSTANVESMGPVVVTLQDEVRTLVQNNNAQAANIIKGMIR